MTVNSFTARQTRQTAAGQPQAPPRPARPPGLGLGQRGLCPCSEKVRFSDQPVPPTSALNTRVHTRSIYRPISTRSTPPHGRDTVWVLPGGHSLVRDRQPQAHSEQPAPAGPRASGPGHALSRQDGDVGCQGAHISGSDTVSPRLGPHSWGLMGDSTTV